MAALQVHADHLVRRGYRVVFQTPTTIELVRVLNFNRRSFTSLSFVGLSLGALAYLTLYLLRRDEKVAVVLDPDGRISVIPGAPD